MVKKISKSKEKKSRGVKPLGRKAEENTSIIKKNNLEKTEEVVKKGKPLDHSHKHGVSNYKNPLVGMNKGVTLNMDNFESFRIDVWLAEETDENTDVKSKFKEISDVLDEQIQIAEESIGIVIPKKKK